MESLDKAKLAEDTIVIFTSDHGDMMGSYDRIGKNVPWDEAINVPFIVRYPRRVKGKQKSDALLCTVDIMPTLLALCGARAPKAVQGRDLSGFVLGKGGKKPESVLVQRLIAGRDPSGIREWRAIRTDRYTYARGKDKPWLLFDNQKDPYQMTNLIDKPESKFLREKLDAELQSWLKRIGDDFAPADEWRRRVRPHASKRLNREEE
jgi:arylsulfatase A-like enzyme